MSAKKQTSRFTPELITKIGYHKGFARALMLGYTKSCARVFAKGYAREYAKTCAKIDPEYKYTGTTEYSAGIAARKYEKILYETLNSCVKDGILTVEEAAQKLDITVSEYRAKIAELKKLTIEDIIYEQEKLKL